MSWLKHLVWLKPRYEYLILEGFALGVGIKMSSHANTIDFTFVINFPSLTPTFKMGLFDINLSKIRYTIKFKHVLSVVICWVVTRLV